MVEARESQRDLLVNGDRIAVSLTSDLNARRGRVWMSTWSAECSGAPSTAPRPNVSAGRRAPGAFSNPLSDVDAIIYGINHEQLSAEARIVSNASCTTNRIVPVLKALDQPSGCSQGHHNYHSAMNDQPVTDSYHNSDLRKTREP